MHTSLVLFILIGINYFFELKLGGEDFLCNNKDEDVKVAAHQWLHSQAAAGGIKRAGLLNVVIDKMVPVSLESLSLVH